MFSWFRRPLRKRPTPQRRLDRPSRPTKGPANPGQLVRGSVAFRRGSESWSEEFDVVQLAADALSQRGHAVTRRDSWLEHASGLILQPLLVELQPLDDGGVRTVTTLETRHAVVPDGLFEYQHATGGDTKEAIANGFDSWAQVDLVTLLDALRDEPAHCATLVLSGAGTDGAPGNERRVVLGPIAHSAGGPPDDGAATGSPADQESHPFCPCCLLTHTMEAFRPLLEGDGFHGIRLYAARDASGAPLADCRVDGLDWERGAEALRAYAASWPRPEGRGYEFRKQYVIVQDSP